ncbi:MAG: PAS domain-containing protein [Candidatus Marinimicrobia bacterium]|nr:PAS domain-containing protein [Candidatus Neomarinimicrobiota bacterium]
MKADSQLPATPGFVCAAPRFTLREAPDGASALRESELRYQAIVEAFDGLIYVCSADYRIEFMNAALIARTGRTAIGEPCYQVLHDRDRICPWCMNERVMRGETVHWEVRSPKDQRWYHVINTPIRHADGTVSKQAMIQDITERKLAEQELQRHREQLEALVQARTSELHSTYAQLVTAEKLSATGKLAAALVHEINNPLCGVRNVLERLRKSPARSAQEEELTELALQEIERVMALVQRLRDFNRPSQDRREPVALHRVLDDILRLLRRRLHQRRIRIQRHYAPDLPPVSAVPDQIRQVLLNLIYNAEEALPATGGHIHLTTGRAEGHAEITVENDGPQVAPACEARLFEPFFTTKATKGSGLGLAVSQQIARHHGGTLCLTRNQPGRVAFTLSLPLTERDHHESSAHPAD